MEGRQGHGITSGGPSDNTLSQGFSWIKLFYVPGVNVVLLFGLTCRIDTVLKMPNVYHGQQIVAK